MNPKQRDHIYRLSENITSTHTLICSNYRNGVRHEQTIEGVDETWAQDSFYENGWRVIRNKVYCPDCVKAKAKK